MEDRIKKIAKNEAREALGGAPQGKEKGMEQRGHMFKCVDCGYQGSKFNVEVIGSHKGALSYVAKCPQCGSTKVNPLPGYREKDVRIGAEPLMA